MPKLLTYTLALGVGVTLFIALRLRTVPQQTVAPAIPEPGANLAENRSFANHKTRASDFAKTNSTGTLTNWIQQSLSGEWPPRPAPEVLQAYVDQEGRSPESLLAAFRACGDEVFLKEAQEKYPADPRVAFASAFQAQTPEEKRRWLDALKQSSPDNALASYLSAGEYFKTGQTELALRDISLAQSQTKWQDFSRDFLVSTEEAYRAGGLSAVEAKAAASFTLPLPHLAKLKQVGIEIGQLSSQYRAQGDDSAAQAAMQTGVNLAQRINENAGMNCIINELVSIALERRLLESLDQTAPYDDSGRTIQQRLDSLIARKEELRSIGKSGQSMLNTQIPEADLMRYLERINNVGEVEALRWLQRRQTEGSGQ